MQRCTRLQVDWINRRSTLTTHVMVHVLNKTIKLKGGRVALNRTGETTKIKKNFSTSAIINRETKAGATGSRPVGPFNRSGLNRRRLDGSGRSGLDRGGPIRLGGRRGHSWLGSAGLLHPRHRSRRHRGTSNGRGRQDWKQQEELRQRQTQAYREQDQEQQEERNRRTGSKPGTTHCHEDQETRLKRQAERSAS